VFSIVAGVIGIDQLYGSQFGILNSPHPPTSEHLSFGQQLIHPFIHSPIAATFGLLAALAGFAGAYVLYSKATADPLPGKLGALSRAMRDRFYFDELYEATVIPVHEAFAKVADFIDRWIIDGFCIGLARGGTDLAGRSLRWLQTGNLQTYALLFAVGVAVVLWLALR
jgi:NADH-quinone oxidoreductase subunit L